MNTEGRSENLIAAHPGNLNALKSGVYSERVREEKAREIRSWLEQASLGQLLDELVLGECEKLLTLRNLLESDIDKNGVVDRRGEMRSIVKARLSISRRIEKILERILSRVPQDDDDEDVAEPQPGSDKYRDRYDALKCLAFDPKAPCNVRIDAIQDLYVSRPPARPSPAGDEAPGEEGPTFANPWVPIFLSLGTENVASEDESRAACGSEADSPTTEWETVRARCLEVLHSIGTGVSNALPTHRRRALKLLQVLDPAPPPSRRDLLLEEYRSWDKERQIRELIEVMPPLRFIDVLRELSEKGLGHRFEIVEQESGVEIVVKSESGKERARVQFGPPFKVVI